MWDKMKPTESWDRRAKGVTSKAVSASAPCDIYFYVSSDTYISVVDWLALNSVWSIALITYPSNGITAYQRETTKETTESPKSWAGNGQRLNESN